MTARFSDTTTSNTRNINNNNNTTTTLISCNLYDIIIVKITNFVIFVSLFFSLSLFYFQ